MPIYIPTNVDKNTTGLKGIFRCPVCWFRQTNDMNYTLNQLEMLLRFSTNQWNNAITSACPNCERSMWLEKVIDKENQLILDVEDWIEKEVERLRMCS